MYMAKCVNDGTSFSKGRQRVKQIILVQLIHRFYQGVPAVWYIIHIPNIKVTGCLSDIGPH